MTKSLIISAELQNWSRIYSFISQYFLKYSISKKDILSITVASEEIFTNIVHHANIESGSKIEIYIDYIGSKRLMTLDFKYAGIKFNPSEAGTPDVKLSVNMRRPGGLGLLIVKKFTDSITYKYSCGKNILKISKKVVNF